jgi:Snare region anchored in the vesicle membrane C-terminus
LLDASVLAFSFGLLNMTSFPTPHSDGGGDSSILRIATERNHRCDDESIAMETEQIGNSTIDQMGRQREQLLGANSNIDRTRQIAEQAASVLKEIGRKAFGNKLCLYVMIGVLILLNLWALVRIFH